MAGIDKKTYAAAVKSVKSYLADSDTLNNIKEQITDIKIYDTFPSTDVLEALTDGTVFEIKGYYSIGDAARGSVFIKDTNKYWLGIVPVYTSDTCKIKPLVANRSTIFFPAYGGREGSVKYAENNSNVISSILSNGYAYGCTIIIPSGHWYFENGINSNTNGISIVGTHTIFRNETNLNGGTWLHFPNLADGDVAITISQNVIKNVVIYGSKSSYSLSIDRDNTYVDVDNIVNESATIKAYGVKGKECTLENVSIQNFYYGAVINTSNTYINNIYFNQCNTGLTIGNDCKVIGCYGWNVMTLLKITGSISSAIQVRADSVGNHLIEVTQGDSIYLSDLDADYCVNSLLHIGNGTYTTVSNLCVNGAHGRCNISKVYDTTSDTAPTANDVTSGTYEQYGFISIAKQTVLNGLIATIQKFGGANPLDSTSNYLTPTILIAAGLVSKVRNVQLFISSSEMTKTWLDEHIAILSVDENNTQMKISNALGTVFIQKNSSSVTYTKESTEELT